MNLALHSSSEAIDSEPCTIPSISVVYPAFNEEANIRHTVEAACRALSTLADRWEVIVVNDGSRDDTKQICDELASANPNVRAIHHSGNQGYGAALKSGITVARHGWIFFSDSDGQFDIRELRDLVRWAGNYDIVAGYRARRSDPPHRLLNAWGWKMLVRLVLGIKIRDIDCAFKLFRRDVFHRVQIRSVGAMVNTEILAQASRFGMKIREVPVSHFPRCHGKSTGADLGVIAKAFRELFRMRRTLQNVSDEQSGLFSEEYQLAKLVPGLVANER